MSSHLSPRRRLASIMAADIVSYSAGMAEDESRMLGFRAEIRDIIAGAATASSGRLFALAGDGFLSEFVSPVEAVRAAHSIQTEVSARRTQQDMFPQLRIGLHLADVVPEGDDLLGDGVNIAVRIESLAQPGRIALSQQILDQVKRTSRLTFEDLGEHELKNIPGLVRLYQVKGEQDLHSYALQPKPRPAPGRAPAGPDLPKVAIMPFANLSSDSEQEYFADGFSEDLVTEASRFRALSVIARNATFAYKGRTIDPSTIARELGATHFVSGSLRRMGTRTRVAIQLARAPSGEAVWAEKFDFEQAEIFEIQDRLARRIAAAVAGKVETDVTLSAKRKPPADLDAYDCLLRGLEHHRFGGVTRHDAEQAVSWINRALEQDPDYGRALAWQACAVSTMASWTGEPWINECIEISNRALALDANDAEVQRIAGSISIYNGELEKALGHFRRGLELNPNHAYLIAKSAEIYNCLGQPDKALELIAEAKDIDRFLPEDCLVEEPRALYLLGRFRDALDQVALYQRPTRWALAYAVASSVHVESRAGIERAVLQLLKLDPDFSVDVFVETTRSKDQAVNDRLRADLRCAGLKP